MPLSTAPAGDRNGPTGPLTIALACPKCGGPFAASDEVVSVTCEHCGSLLVLEAPERDEIYLAEDRIRDEAEILDIVITYKVEAYRSELAGRLKEGSEDPVSMALVALAVEPVAAYERKLRSVARLLEAHRIHVPYWHITGMIVQGILGRRGPGAKIVRLRAFVVEHTVPAYDTRRANLRDRGLRLSRSRVRPLTAREAAERAPFLPWAPVAEQPYREVERWKGQDLDAGTEAVTKHGLFLFGRRVLVYRPYWLARVVTDAGEDRILVDGGFATLAGHPSEAEVQGLMNLGIDDPLRSGEPPYWRVHVVASRCPDCGFEQRIDPRYFIAVCPNCHRGLDLTPSGIRLVRYARAARGPAPLDAAYLAFWRYRFSVQLTDGRSFEGLEEYARAVFPQGLPPGFHASGRHLWIPAFRLLGTEPGDAAFKAVLEWIHGAPPVVVEEKVPLGGRAVAWGVSVREEEARALGPFVLLGLHGKASAARLNTLLLRKAVIQAKLTLSEPTLVMVPFDVTGDELRIEGTSVRVPTLLLRGGPELDARRATVQAAKAATERSQIS